MAQSITSQEMETMAEGNRALFIDRDGTINRDCPYCFKPEDLVLYRDTLKLMREYQEQGYLIIIITNQSGIGRKYFTVEQMNRICWNCYWKAVNLRSQLPPAGFTIS